MSGRKSKRKGYSGENEFAKLTGGRRVPLSGAVEGEEWSNDVVLPNGWKVEVKRRKEMEKTLYGWLEDQREKPHIVAFRGDRKPWVISMFLERFMYLMECEEMRKEQTELLSNAYSRIATYESTIASLESQLEEARNAR